MGILNVTPDSFSDGGRYRQRDQALRHAEAMVAAGAAIIDVGGESTRPGAAAVGESEELDRVIPVVEALADASSLPISIDTTKAAVMREAVAAGAGMINDVRALREEGALEAAAECGVPICLMHMQGEPRTMQQSPVYDDVAGEVESFLADRRDTAVAAGIAPQQLLYDPGFGFGKSLQHNLALARSLTRLARLGPLLVGVSRKSMIGALLNDAPVEERLPGSLALALWARLQGARLIRVHDVAETVAALRVIEAVADPLEEL
jgi:dihydropteroate synthase